MRERMSATLASPAMVRKNRKPGFLKGIWQRVRKPLARSAAAKQIIATAIVQSMRLVRSTNPLVEGSSDAEAAYLAHMPAIVTLWHGQHLMAPAYFPKGRRLLAMVSRSADAELNALVVEKFGFAAVRGSGGREGRQRKRKGGAKALLALKKALDDGSTVSMIADIPHGTPRDAGMGVVTLARISGRPIVPVAIATSRRRVLAGTWDKTTLNLPFGRGAFIVGEPILVRAEADDAELERKRVEVTSRLNEATARAYGLVDQHP